MQHTETSDVAMVKNQTANPELFLLELFVTLQIDADPWTGLRRAQRRVAGGLCLPVLGGRTGSLARTGHQKTDVKLDMLSKPRESLRRPPLPRAARPRGTSDNPWKV